VGAWKDRVVSLSMKPIALDADGCDILVRNLDAFGIRAGIDFSPNPQSSLGGGGRDQIDDHFVTDHGFAASVLTNEGEQSLIW